MRKVVQVKQGKAFGPGVACVRQAQSIRHKTVSELGDSACDSPSRCIVQRLYIAAEGMPETPTCLCCWTGLRECLHPGRNLTCRVRATRDCCRLMFCDHLYLCPLTGPEPSATGSLRARLERDPRSCAPAAQHC